MGIIAFVYLYLRRQKKAKRQETHENMPVNWDEIEEHYKEVSTAKPNILHLTGSTVITENINGRQHSPDSVAATTDFSLPKNNSPDTVVNIIKPSVSSIDNYTTVKPDRK